MGCHSSPFSACRQLCAHSDLAIWATVPGSVHQGWQAVERPFRVLQQPCPLRGHREQEQAVVDTQYFCCMQAPSFLKFSRQLKAYAVCFAGRQFDLRWCWSWSGWHCSEGLKGLYLVHCGKGWLKHAMCCCSAQPLHADVACRSITCSCRHSAC